MPAGTAASSPIAIARHPKDRGFIADQGLRNSVHNSQPGVMLKVRLTSYRSLPLSCIEGIELSIDGEQIDPQNIVLILNNYGHKLDELRGLSKVWWFILDYADLFVPHAPLEPGVHDVQGTLVTVEPYATAGRFSFYNSSSKRLRLESGGPEDIS